VSRYRANEANARGCDPRGGSLTERAAGRFKTDRGPPATSPRRWAPFVTVREGLDLIDLADGERTAEGRLANIRERMVDRLGETHPIVTRFDRRHYVYRSIDRETWRR
jgi:hypothetical protein